MLDFSKSKEPGRVIRHAVLDDVSPMRKGEELIYWRGGTDFDPIGHRREAFNAASELQALGRVVLYQKRHGDGDYEYRARVM